MRDARAAIAVIFVMGIAMLIPNLARAAQSQPAIQSHMLVSTAWLQEHLHDRGLVVVCVGRNRSSYDVGHIPGARFLLLDSILEQHSDSLNNLAPVATLQAALES